MASKLKLTELLYPTSTTPAITINADDTVTFGAPTTTITNISATNLAYTGTLTGGTGVVNIGSGQVYKDAAGNVGVGTSSPSGKLDVDLGVGVNYVNLSATGSGQAVVLSLLGGTSSEQAICYNTTALRFGTVTGKNAAGFSERMRIDSSGNVGIGTSSPAEKLHVLTSSNYAATFNSAIASATTTRISIGGFTTSGGGVGGSVAIGSEHNHSGTSISSMVFYTYGGGSLAERARIDTSGNFLVGTTAASYGVSGRGVIEVNGSSESLIAFKIGGGTTNSVYQYNTATNFETNVNGSRYCNWTVNGSERMRIDSSGRFLVGTTGLSGGGATQFSSSGDKVTINSFGGSYGQLQIGNPTAAAEASIAFIPGVSSYGAPPSSGNADNVWVVGAAIGSAGSLAIFNQGLNGIVCSITRSSTSWTFTSDERLKNINGGIENALAKVGQLRAVYYNWKSEPEGKQKVGLLAQDVLKVLPEAVTIPEQDADKDGNPTYLGLGMSDVVPLLTAAIQEQQALIQDLTTRLTKLEGN